MIDAGANVGTHAMVYARTADRVLAFEPQWFVYKLLVMNTLLNCADNVMPYWCALGQECGMVRIPSSSPDAENISGGVDVGEGDDLVKIVTLDSLKLEKVSLLKVDVERSMLSVLYGARETIKRDRPVLYVENNFGDEVDAALCAFLSEMGYAWQEVIVPAFPHENFNGAMEDIFLPGLVNRNFLCLPKERML